MTPPTGAAVPRLSVVVTTYQHARYLGDALDSVLTGQPPVHEVLVVDDGSTDRPDLVVARYPGVRLLRQDNRGLSSARNTGLARCTGDYVLFLDADDRLVPGGLEAAYEVVAAHPDAALVYGAHVRTGPDGRGVTSTVYVPVQPDHAHAQFLQGNPIGMNATALMSRSAVMAAGGFDETLNAAEDYDLYLRLVAAQPVHSHPAVVAAYRIHDTNMSADPGFMLTAVLRVLARQRSRVVHDPKLRTALGTGVGVWIDYYREQARVRTAAMPDDRASVRRAELLAARLFPRAVGGPLLRRAARTGRRRARAALRRRAEVVLPLQARARLARARGSAPPVGAVRLGDLDRTSPIGPDFGYRRGGPVDRYYIEGFLARHQADVRGRVLEVGDDFYTRTYGRDRVQRCDVLHVHADNPLATFVGDLGGDNDLPSNAFDCVVLTQVLQLVYDVPAAMRTLHRVLRPGGVLLATVPGISKIDPDEWGPTWYWSFTAHAVQRLAEEPFGQDGVRVTSHGNVKAAVTFLHGLGRVEVDPADLDRQDPCYPVVVCLRAVKAG